MSLSPSTLNMMSTDVDDAPLEPTGVEARRDALRDLYGWSDVKSFEEGEVMLATARKQLEEALQILPKDDGFRYAYDEAMEKAPHLVEMESNPTLYLRASDYDPWAAANNIVMYWKIRKDFFGDRSFMPMVASGKGALSEEDIEALKCGGASILPPDSSNRYVFFTDRARYCPRCCSCEDVRARIVFYLLQSVLDNDHVPRSGMIIAASIDTNDKRRSNENGMNAPGLKMLKLFKTGAFPIPFRAFHLFVLRKRSFLETSVPIWLHTLERWKFISMRSVVHYCESKEAAINEMKQYGFKEEHTPEQLGGTFREKEEFEKWFQSRLDLEQKKYEKVTLPSPSGEFFSQKPPGSLPTEASLNALEDLAAAAEKARVEEAKIRKRKLDAIYQRNKRESERSSVLRLREQMVGLRRDNGALKKEHESLQILMERARLAIADHNKEQQQQQVGLEGMIRTGVPILRAMPVPSMASTAPLSPRHEASITSASQHVAQSSNNNNSFFGGLLRYFPATGAPAMVHVPPAMNNMAHRADVDFALLQSLQASGAGPGSSHRVQDLQLRQQDLLLHQQQQFHQLHLIQRQAEVANALLGANHHPNHLHVFNNHLATPLSATSSAASNLLHQQRHPMTQTEQDLLESILRRQRG